MKQYLPLMMAGVGWIAAGVLLVVLDGRLSPGWGIATVVVFLGGAVIAVRLQARRTK